MERINEQTDTFMAEWKVIKLWDKCINEIISERLVIEWANNETNVYVKACISE